MTPVNPALTSPPDAGPLPDPFSGDWRGVPWEPAVECVACGQRISASTSHFLRKAKNDHRCEGLLCDKR